MSDSIADRSPPLPRAEIRPRRSFQIVWLIPIVAGLVGAYLAWQAISREGPTITLQFRSGDGLTAGQTKVKHKAVDLGTVRAIRLSPDMSHVDVRVDMTRDASDVLTDQARFWVVRPRLTAGSISGLDTLVSGSYIELDPGQTRGKSETNFVGLEEPAAVRSDEPGHTFNLVADRIGSLSSGSPVFYRDITVGEVLGYDLGPNGRGVTLHVFVRAPFDGYIRQDTHFWNASGLGVELGATGLKIQVASLQAVLSGGIAFDSPKDAPDSPASLAGANFPLYADETTANTAGYQQRIPFVTYFEGSVRGLGVGSPVELYGIQIGNVTDVKLQFDPTGASARVAVKLEVQPERIVDLAKADTSKPIDVARTLVKRGLRLQLHTANYLTGQMVLAMDFFPNMAQSDVALEGDAIVLPSTNGGLDSITNNLSDIAAKLGKLPLDEIAKNLNDTLRGASQLANGPELKQALQALAGAMTGARDVLGKLDAGASPFLKRLPEIAQGLQAAVDRASRLVASAESGYGEKSDFKRDLQRLLIQAGDTARSVRLLADYLDQHPEALVRGRTDRAGER